MLSHFDKTLVCDRRTDGHAQGHRAIYSIVSRYKNPTNERQKVTLKVFSTCNCHIQHTACQAAGAAGGWAFIAEQRQRHVRAGRCAGCAHAHRGAGWAWRDMQMDASSCSWGFGRPGIGSYTSSSSMQRVRNARQVSKLDGRR